MIPQKMFVFADNQTSAYTSKDCANAMSDLIDLQLSGEFTSCLVNLEGKVDLDADYQVLKVINLSKFEAVDDMEEAGIYEAAISGMQSLRVVINSVDGGAIKIVGRIMKEG